MAKKTKDMAAPPAPLVRPKPLWIAVARCHVDGNVFDPGMTFYHDNPEGQGFERCKEDDDDDA